MTSDSRGSLQPDWIQRSGSIDESLGGARMVLLVVGIIVSVGFPLFVIFCPAERVVWYLSDDAYYYFCVAGHLAASGQLSAEGITPTTGVHPLYTLVLAGLYRLWPVDAASLGSLDRFVRLVLLVNASLFWVAGWGLYRAGVYWAGKSGGRWAILLWLVNGPAVLVTVIGLEGALYFAVVAWLVASLVKWARSSQVGWKLAFAVGVLVSLAVATRSDAILLIPVVVLWIIWQGRRSGNVGWSKLVPVVVLPLVTLSVWMLFSYQQTGLAVSGSALAKSHWRQLKTAGLISSQLALFFGILWAWTIKCIFKVSMLKYAAVLLAGYYRKSRKSLFEQWERRLLLLLVAVPLILGIAYGMVMERTRTWYYAPCLVILTFVASVLWNRYVCAARAGGKGRGARLAWIIVLVVALEGLVYTGAKVGAGRSPDQQEGLKLALWIRDNLPADAIVGDWDSGIRGFYSNRRVINLDGLANNEIMGVYRGQISMQDYWLKRNIRYILYNTKDMAKLDHAWPGGRLEVLHEPVWIVQLQEQGLSAGR